MSVYKRLIAYFCYYERGHKRSCPGYAKFEMRDDHYKINFRVNVGSMNGRELKLYAILPFREGNGLFQLDTLTANRGIVEGQYELRTLPDANSIQGIIMSVSDDRYYGASWAEDVVTGPFSIINEVSETIHEENTQQIQEGTVSIQDKNIVADTDVSVESDIPADTDIPADSGMSTNTEVPVNINITASTNTPADSVIPTDTDISEYAGNANIVNSSIDTTSMLTDTSIILNDVKNQTTSKRNPVNVSDNTIKDNEDIGIRRMFSLCTRYYPFDDYELSDCIKIEPRDIGMLPSDLWNFVNNSFLLHGYYNYGHLLFAKKGIGQNKSYLLMVPGVNCKREAMLSKRYGFEDFKCVRSRECGPGEFGYWYYKCHKSLASSE